MSDPTAEDISGALEVLKELREEGPISWFVVSRREGGLVWGQHFDETEAVTTAEQLHGLAFRARDITTFELLPRRADGK